MTVPAGKVFIRTFGCQMNGHDSGKLLLTLAPSYVPVPTPEQADLILLNTCSIREKAEHKVYSYLGRLGPLKAANPRLLIAVGGCVAQQQGRRLIERSPLVDVVFGPHNLEELPALLAERIGTGRRICRVPQAAGEWNESAVEAALPDRPGPAPMVTIMKGCDNFCSYCVVPLVRGRERSRPAAAVLEEVRELVARGAVEVTLLGQNVNSYRDPARPDARGGAAEKGAGFVELLERVSGVPGLQRLRFTTSHPRDLSPRVVEAMASLPNLCNHIHLPLQSGSDRILDAMRRGYTAAQYRERIDLLRERVPGVEITTDVIVGFPGETRQEFEQSLRLTEELRFQNSFSFRYSPRPGTAAAALADPVDPASRQGWLPELQALQDSVTIAKHEALVGAELTVLVEGRGTTGEGARLGGDAPLEGRTANNYIVHFPGASALIGRMARVRALRARKVHLEGELLS